MGIPQAALLELLRKPPPATSDQSSDRCGGGSRRTTAEEVSGGVRLSGPAAGPQAALHEVAGASAGRVAGLSAGLRAKLLTWRPALGSALRPALVSARSGAAGGRTSASRPVGTRWSRRSNRSSCPRPLPHDQQWWRGRGQSSLRGSIQGLDLVGNRRAARWWRAVDLEGHRVAVNQGVSEGRGRVQFARAPPAGGSSSPARQPALLPRWRASGDALAHKRHPRLPVYRDSPGDAPEHKNTPPNPAEADSTVAAPKLDVSSIKSARACLAARRLHDEGQLRAVAAAAMTECGRLKAQENRNPSRKAKQILAMAKKLLVAVEHRPELASVGQIRTANLLDASGCVR
jgi:hypothetical protein